MQAAETIDLSVLKEILTQFSQHTRAELIPILFEAQKQYGYLSEPLVAAIGESLRIPLADIHGVIEFYTMLYNEPVGETVIRVCTSPVCVQSGSKGILNSLYEHLGTGPGEITPDRKYTIEEVPCLCLCDHAPAALVGETPVGSISTESAVSKSMHPEAVPLGTIGGDERWLTARCGEMEPLDLDAFIQLRGYAGLRHVLEDLSPAEVIAELKTSGLAGRGGAAFPTGLKWEFTAASVEEPRYIVCNGDESEPGTFKDRVLMEGDPFSILEGMTIAAFAVGAEKGYLFIRGEYPRAQRMMQSAMDIARAQGFLGKDILGANFSFDIELRSGAGAYICGEETALFEAIEGKRGFPRLKPPYPTTHGLFGKPTAINNVETLSAAAWIIANGAEKYRSRGTSESPGLKLFCLSGDVRHPGIYEAPFGVSLRELVNLAGGFVGDPQAILIGGAAGKFATKDDLDLEMSFEGLKAAGHTLGSGVVMVINQDRDLRLTLYSLADFFAHESCGKCYPCRLGTQRQIEIIEKAINGNAASADFVALEDVGFAMINTSLCGLGMTAGLAIGSAREKFPDLFNLKIDLDVDEMRDE
jgi:NADH-quinone oxidoreductase subunit F